MSGVMMPKLYARVIGEEARFQTWLIPFGIGWIWDSDYHAIEFGFLCFGVGVRFDA